jgi:hypothetical protein
MYLSANMFVDIHGQRLVLRLVGRKKPDEGWTFHCIGNYNRTGPEESNHFIPKICGLRAAAAQYLRNVQVGSYGASPSPAS